MKFPANESRGMVGNSGANENTGAFKCFLWKLSIDKLGLNGAGISFADSFAQSILIIRKNGCEWIPFSLNIIN